MKKLTRHPFTLITLIILIILTKNPINETISQNQDIKDHPMEKMRSPLEEIPLLPTTLPSIASPEFIPFIIAEEGNHSEFFNVDAAGDLLVASRENVNEILFPDVKILKGDVIRKIQSRIWTRSFTSK